MNEFFAHGLVWLGCILLTLMLWYLAFRVYILWLHRNDILWPKTWSGWKVLFWLTLRCCPEHHSLMHPNWPMYDDGITLYCLECDGVARFPNGMLQALIGNKKAVELKKQKSAETEKTET